MTGKKQTNRHTDDRETDRHPERRWEKRHEKGESFKTGKKKLSWRME